MAKQTKTRANKLRKRLTPAEIKNIFIYVPETGELRWRKNNRLAGYDNPILGYRYVGIQYGCYLVHRVAYAYMTGSWPPMKMDHISGNRRDNRWINLRLANDTQNACNKCNQSNNTTGYKGVTYRHNRRHWYAQIVIEGKHRYLGAYKTPEEAYIAYCDAAIKLHKEFARLA